MRCSLHEHFLVDVKAVTSSKVVLWELGELVLKKIRRTLVLEISHFFKMKRDNINYQ